MNHLVLAIVALTFSSSLAAKLPSTWTVCKNSDPKRDECLKGAIQGAIDELTKGSPSLGVLPLEPLHFNYIGIDQSSGPVSINLTFQNLDVHNVKSSKVKSVKSDWDNYELDISFEIQDPLIFIGDYIINGKILVLPISGNGKTNLTFDDVSLTLKFRGKETTKGGKKYIDMQKTSVDFDTKKLHVHFQNLFNGDKALGDNMNKFMNENWEIILKELKPAVSDSFGEAIRQISNRVFHKIPKDTLVP